MKPVLDKQVRRIRATRDATLTALRLHSPWRGGFDVPAARRRRGLSLLETMIAIGILGVGLIMVAAVFPVALSQHRDTVDEARANELSSKAQAMLTSRIDPAQLWIPAGAANEKDSPWYLLPSPNLACDDLVWGDVLLRGQPSTDAQFFYADIISFYGSLPDSSGHVPPARPLPVCGLDILSDRTAPGNGRNGQLPFTDAEFAEAPGRMAWYGFYRRLANGSTSFALALCRQQRHQLFAAQDLTVVDATLTTEAQNPYAKPVAAYASPANGWRLPVPWRVSVGVVRSRRLFNTQTAPMLGAGIPLGTLAPRGARMMIQGAVHEDPLAGGNAFLPVPAGRILTVANVLYDAAGSPTIVEVVEDTNDLPLFNPYSGKYITFDVWLFPPAIVGGALGDSSPLIDWKANL
jgi:hypothetical protein